MEQPSMESSPELVLAPELAAGERLLWSGRPIVGRVGAKAKVLIFFVPLVFFALMFGVIFLVSRPLPAFPMGPALFLLAVSIVMSSAVLGVAALQAKQLRGMVYGVTAKRALVATLGVTKTVLSWDAEKIGGAIEKVERPDGSGDLLFRNLARGYDPALPSALSRTKYSPRIPGFYNVPDVNAVERILRQAFDKA